MKKLLAKLGFKSKPAPIEIPAAFTGIDPKRITAAAVSQVSSVIEKISGGDVTIELAIAHVVHERAKAKYFTISFPASNDDRKQAI